MTSAPAAKDRVPEPARTPSRWRRLLFGLGLPIVLLLIGEAAVRVVDPEPPSTLLRAPLDRMFMVITPEFFHDDPHVFWRLKRDLDVPPVYLGDRSDSLGLRNLRTPGPKGDSERIVCVGDSCTYGLGVPIEAAWPTLIGEETDWDVVNAGVPGYTTFQAVRQWETLLADLEADRIVIEFGNNDLVPWPAREGAEWVFATDRERSRHIAYTLTPPLGSRLLQVLAGHLWLPPPERHQADAPMEVHAASRSRVPLDEFRRNLEFLASRAPRAVFLIWPHRVQIEPSPTLPIRMQRLREYQRTIREVASAGGHDVVDVVALFQESGLPAPELFVDDVHASAAGCRLVADAVIASLREQ